MKWNILNEGKNSEDIIAVLLKNRGIKSLDLLKLDKITFPGLVAAAKRIKKGIKDKESIVVYGDYDADGICATAIMWETLRDLGAKVMPFIPQREKEGYGLSKEGVDEITDCQLLITVDSGIVANSAVEYAKKKGMDVIVIDHHEKPKKLPKAKVIVHTNKLCAAGMAYILSKKLGGREDLLELAAIATVTDMMPLVDWNRAIVKLGLEKLNKTNRSGLRALFNVAGIEKVGTYEIGYMIGPRLNASGRIESALTALRMLCTRDFSKALEWAKLLNDTNRTRQIMTEEMTTHALQNTGLSSTEKIIVIESETYHQGVIGLVAGKLVEKYYLPAIVISRGETISKASARSIGGFNIIEAIREFENLLVNAGGHPMAAGFTIETTRIKSFETKIKSYAQKTVTAAMLERTLRVDMELDLGKISIDLYKKIAEMEPFGLGNPEPVFAGDGKIENVRTVGQGGKHLKLVVSGFDAIGFGMGSLAAKLKVGDLVRIAYSIVLDTFNGNHKLQLKIKDLIRN